MVAAVEVAAAVQQRPALSQKAGTLPTRLARRKSEVGSRAEGSEEGTMLATTKAVHWRAGRTALLKLGLAVPKPEQKLEAQALEVAVGLEPVVPVSET